LHSDKSLFAFLKYNFFSNKSSILISLTISFSINSLSHHPQKIIITFWHFILIFLKIDKDRKDLYTNGVCNKWRTKCTLTKKTFPRWPEYIIREEAHESVVFVRFKTSWKRSLDNRWETYWKNSKTKHITATAASAFADTRVIPRNVFGATERAPVLRNKLAKVNVLTLRLCQLNSNIVKRARRTSAEILSLLLSFFYRHMPSSIRFHFWNSHLLVVCFAEWMLENNARFVKKRFR